MDVLPREQYGLAHSALNNVATNHLFARSVIERHVSGTVFVDSRIDPRVFYVVHPYGMTLLFGEIDDQFIQDDFKSYVSGANGLRRGAEWLQVYPVELERTIDAMFGDNLMRADDNQDENGALRPGDARVIKHTRVNYRFDREQFETFKRTYTACECDVVRTDHRLFREVTGCVVANRFWDTANDFAEKGVGFTLRRNAETVSTAFSAFVHSGLLELGTETRPEFRKMGAATFVCSQLIDYCTENGFEPVWSCRLGNQASFQLARRLGFEPVKYLPYYELAPI